MDEENWLGGDLQARPESVRWLFAAVFPVGLHIEAWWHSYRVTRRVTSFLLKRYTEPFLRSVRRKGVWSANGGL